MLQGEWAAVCRTAALSISILLFVARLWSRTAPYAPAYPLLTVIFGAAIAAIVLTWSRSPAKPATATNPRRAAAVAAAGVSVALVVYFAQRWVDALLWNAYRADMLIIIREATERFLDGRNPYSTYRNTYDAPWDFVLSYGPLLWGPFVAPQLLRMDMRVVTVVGELFIPLWCGMAMTVEAARGRLYAAAAWCVLCLLLLVSIDVPEYTLMGHTPVYWPLLPIFAVVVIRRHWLTAAFALGVLVAARSTMVTLFPILLMANGNPEFDGESTIAAKALREGISAIALPRDSVSAADIIIAWRASRPSTTDTNEITAYLNGRPVWTTRLVGGPQEIRFAAPRSAWWVGHNRLELKHESQHSQPPGLTITRVAVIPRT